MKPLPLRRQLGKPDIWHVGDSVCVIAGVSDEGFAVDMEGWQGRIAEVLKQKNLIRLAEVRDWQ